MDMVINNVIVAHEIPVRTAYPGGHEKSRKFLINLIKQNVHIQVLDDAQNLPEGPIYTPRHLSSSIFALYAHPQFWIVPLFQQ